MKHTTRGCKALFARVLAAVMVLTTVFTLYQPLTAEAAGETLLNTYGTTYGYSGTCINLYQLRNATTLNQIKKQYNSITLENEMKPDALLGSYCKSMTVSQAKNQGYYIPSNYNESNVPTINFAGIDEAMKICYENGLKMRAHTLVWHSQTPTWFFRSNYSGSGSFVSTSTMDARLEMYVKTVMNHVYSSPYGSVVYAWDVVNEIQHASNSGWEAVYGNNRKQAAYVKKAFQYAYDCLDYFGLVGKVKLFSNDYNTYMVVDDEIALINYVNSEKKLCDGIGMQSHLGTNYPSTDYYLSALNSFLKAGLEVQITEMDITNKGDQDMADYCTRLFNGINQARKNGGKITGITWWGLSDQVTWINNAKPLLFSSPDVPKAAYYSVINSYTSVFGNNAPVAGNNDTTPSQPSNPSTPSQPSNNSGSQATIADGWYYIKGVGSQKYLQVAGNTGKNVANVEIGTGTGVDGQIWKVTNTGNGYFTLTSKLGNYNLDIANGVADNGANVQLYSSHGLDAQQLMVKTTGRDGVYQIATKCSNTQKVLDVEGKKTADGTNVCQYTSNGQDNQMWVFEPVTNTNTGNNNTGNNNTGNNNTGNNNNQTQPSNPSTSDQPATTGKVTAEYSINNWGSGYQVSIKVVNKTGATVNTWTLTIPKSQVNITASWNVNIKESGSNYVITPVSWNSTIANGGSVEFGIQGTGSIGNTVSITAE